MALTCGQTSLLQDLLIEIDCGGSKKEWKKEVIWWEGREGREETEKKKRGWGTKKWWEAEGKKLVIGRDMGKQVETMDIME